MSEQRIVIQSDDPRIVKCLNALMDADDDPYDLVTDGYTRAEVETALWTWVSETIGGLLDDLLTEVEATEPTLFDFLPKGGGK